MPSNDRAIIRRIRREQDWPRVKDAYAQVSGNLDQLGPPQHSVPDTLDWRDLLDAIVQDLMYAPNVDDVVAIDVFRGAVQEATSPAYEGDAMTDPLGELLGWAAQQQIS